MSDEKRNMITEIFEIRHKFRDLNIVKDVIKDQHAVFAEEREHTFDMLCRSDCDDSMLNQMLKAKNSVECGETTQHDASVAVGEVLVNKFVKPAMEGKKGRIS